MKKKSTKHNKSVLLIIDMINRFDFPEGRDLKKAALPVAKKIAKLKKRFKARDFPVVYVNDNFGEWDVDWKSIYTDCVKSRCLGSELAQILKPDQGDYFILKPKHSGFHLTSLEALLEKLNLKKLVITGIAGDICVLFTAHDAHMRGFDVTVPRDCIASNTRSQNEVALSHLTKALKLKTPLSSSV